MARFPDTIPAEEVNVWATMIPYRSPEFKVHKSEGLANAAMGQRGVGESFAKYELVDGKWIKRFEYHPPSNCSRCSAALRVSGMRRQEYIYKGPNYMAPVICNDCYKEDRDEYYRVLNEKREREQLARLQAKYN